MRAAAALACICALTGCAGLAPRSAPPPRPAALAVPANETEDLLARHAAERQTLVDIAASMLGQPYRWGGAAPGGFDCSGLVAYAAGGAGVQVPRTALEQFRQSEPVKGSLRQGDLVFMHLARKELHVGIAMGDGRFIHAPSTGGRVRIDSLSAKPYAKGFIGARTIIPEP